jgi:signal transduction histidine kinase
LSDNHSHVKAKLIAVALAGAVAAAGAVWLAANGGGPDRPTEPGPLLTLVVGASLLGCGLGSWRTRPDNLIGPVMVLTGFAWFAGLLTEANDPALYTAGEAVEYAFVAGFVYLVLAFPSGRLRSRLDRTLVAAALAIAIGLQLAAMLFGNRTGLRCTHCPDNLFQVVDDNTRAQHLLDLQRLGGAALTVTAVALLLWRWLQASRPQRRAVAPVLIAGTATLLALTGTIVNDLTGDQLRRVPANVFFYTFATVPIAVLVVFAQRRLARGQVAGLVVQLGEQGEPTDLRDALAGALGDPSLQLAFWYPAEQRYVSADGRPIQLPEAGSGRMATFVERPGQPVAVLLHDPALEHNAELVQSVCAAAALTLENERLQAELRARLSELQASRTRLVEATESERRRIERDLHDGTQQRLVSIAMSLGLLDSKLLHPEQARPIVQETRAALTATLAELRVLTQGIHPTILAERGLAAALDELAKRGALPVRLRLSIDGRLPDQVEGAGYFLVSEALTNAVKHAHANEVEVDACHEGDVLRIEVRDDGIGGAATSGGSGLRGLADRVEAVGGTLTVSSPPGRGTMLKAVIPCA